MVTIATQTDGAQMNYTVDGSTPGPNSPLYTGPLTFKDNTTLKAVGYKVGYTPSDVMTEVYVKQVEKLPMPVANQIEIHPWSQKPGLVRYLNDNAITPIAYSSLVPLASWRTGEGENSAKTEQMKADGEAHDAPFKVMAKKYGVSEAQVLLRWAVQKGYPVLPRSIRADRIRNNADIFGFQIDAADMAAIEGMDRGDGVAWAIGDPTKAP